VRSRLRDDGLFVQWAQLYNMNQDGVGTMLRSLAEAFPHIMVLEVGGGSAEVMLVGSPAPLVLSYPAVAGLFANGESARELARVGAPTPGSILGRVLLDDTAARRLAAAYPANTDDNARLEFHALDNLYADTTDANRVWMRAGAVDPLERAEELPAGPDARHDLLVDMARTSLNASDLPRGVRFAEAAIAERPSVEAHRLLGDLLYASDRLAAVDAWRDGLRVAPDDTGTLLRLARHFQAAAPAFRPAEYAGWLEALPPGALLVPDEQARPPLFESLAYAGW
jgi:hypothetical protein